jgi:hypothetical protein
MNKEKVLYQEIEIVVKVVFEKVQSLYPKGRLENWIKEYLFIKYVPNFQEEPQSVEEVEATSEYAIIKISTNIDWRKNEPDISNYVIGRVKKKLPMKYKSIQLISIKEEAEIYAYNIKDLIKDIELDSKERYKMSFLGDKYNLLEEGYDFKNKCWNDSDNTGANYRMIEEFIKEDNSNYKLAKSLWDNRGQKDCRELTSFDFKITEFVDLLFKNRN